MHCLNSLKSIVLNNFLQIVWNYNTEESLEVKIPFEFWILQILANGASRVPASA